MYCYCVCRLSGGDQLFMGATVVATQYNGVDLGHLSSVVPTPSLDDHCLVTGISCRLKDYLDNSLLGGCETLNFGPRILLSWK